MQHTIQHITQELVGRLPENEQYFRPEELKKLGFPLFVVRRIAVELERNLSETTQIPKTDWANMHSDRVQDAWDHFLQAIRAEAYLPASYASPVIETGVADVIEILVQPRKNIPEVIFGGDESLTRGEIVKRMEAVVVYRHFATLLDRYMERKELERMTKERCQKIVAKADEKLTRRYTPLNWAQMLQPLFLLMDEQIDTNLLRLFFEDKKLPRVARKFDLMDSRVNRAELIEVLSSPDLLNFEGYEEDQPDLFKGEPADQDEGARDLNSLFGGDSEEDQETRGAEEYLEEEQEAQVEDDEEETSLNYQFEETEEEESDTRETGEDDETSVPDAEELVDIEPSPATEEMEEAAPEEPEPETEQLTPDVGGTTPGNQTGEGEEETPMWQRFMSPEQIEEFNERLKEEQEQLDEIPLQDQATDEQGGVEDTDEKDTENEPEDDSESEMEDGFIDEPIIDLTKSDEPDEQEIARLEAMFDEDRERFVENIFGGSERAFEDALEEIATRDSWNKASKYIEKEIFKRNLVDVYSEAAVDFTDRLQTYFLEKSKS